MKIGILTFHSQLNYGGVLQCWALKTALTRLLSEKFRVKNEECVRALRKNGAEFLVGGERERTVRKWRLI